jgi:peptide/nickel transport system substrate-binding protein
MFDSKRRIIALALVGGAVALASGCGSSSSNGSSSGGGSTSSGGGSHMGGTMKLQATGNPDSLDPAIAYEVESWQNLIMTNDGLMGFKRVGGPDGATLVPDLATAIPHATDGGKTYVFHIRPNIKFSNGEPVVPSDFKHAWERDFLVGSPGTWTLESIVGASKCTAKKCDLSSGVVADDSGMTLTVHLTAPDPEFLDKVALPFSDAVNKAAPNKDVGTNPLPATGPYMFKSYVPGQSITLVRNPQFHVWSKDAQPQGYPNEISWQLGLQADAEVTNVEQGHADWMFEQPPPGRLNEIATQYKNQVHINPLTATYWFFMNTRVAPFNNLKVRQALNYAVDRNATIKLYGGPALAQPTCQVLPPNFPGYSQYCPYTKNPASGGKGPWTAPDMAKAKQLIDQSGTKGQNVTVWSETTTLSKSEGEYIVSLLNQLGYHASLKSLDRGVYFDTVDNSSNKAQIGWWDWYQDYPAASDFINTLLSCSAFIPNDDHSNNAAEFCNQGVDSTIKTAINQGATSTAAANQSWAKADQQITDQAPWLSLFNPKNIDFVSKRVGNYQFSPQWLFLLDQAWVQ